jgi:hypothetical protein
MPADLDIDRGPERFAHLGQALQLDLGEFPAFDLRDELSGQVGRFAHIDLSLPRAKTQRPKLSTDPEPVHRPHGGERHSSPAYVGRGPLP